MIDRPIWHAAATLAARAHRGQLRRDGRTPYVAHPARVALIVAGMFGVTDETILAAALLHDVIEDADVDYDDVSEACGSDVADLVAALSKDMRLVEPQRERDYDARLAAAPWPARLIKLADVYDNMADANSPEDRRTLMSRARRALALAEGEPRLERPAAMLGRLVSAVEKETA